MCVSFAEPIISSTKPPLSFYLIVERTVGKIDIADCSLRRIAEAVCYSNADIDDTELNMYVNSICILVRENMRNSHTYFLWLNDLALLVAATPDQYEQNMVSICTEVADMLANSGETLLTIEIVRND